jgi:predicted DNA-binding protein
MEKEVTYIRLEPEAKRRLARLAKMDGRSLAALINKVLSDWLQTQQPAREPRR